MVKIADVVLGIRSRLGDTDVHNQDYSDAEIIDAVNSALAHLSEDLLCFSRTWLIPTKEGIGRYELPSDFLRLISVKFKGATITKVESMEARSNRKYHCTAPSVSLDMQTIHLFPSEGIKEGERVELYYHYFETINDESDSVSLPNNAKESMVYYALALLMENPVQSDGVQQANRYRQLYEVEKQKLASRVRKNAQSKHIRTSYQRV